jgi:hypothetical protein
MLFSFGVAFAALAVIILTRCGSGNGGGGNNNPPPTITSVSTSPASATVQIGLTQQFTPTVKGTGSLDSTVNWFVNDAMSGNSTVGTIDISGLYTAPSAVPNPATVTVKACSRMTGYTDVCGTASVTIVWPTSKPALLWEKTNAVNGGIGFTSTTSDRDGNLIAAGLKTIGTATTGLPAGIVVSYDPNGNERWAFDMGTQQSGFVASIIGPDGLSSFHGGSMTQNNDVSKDKPLLVKLADDGSLESTEETCDSYNNVDIGALAKNSSLLFLGLGRPGNLLTADFSGNINCAQAILGKDGSRVTSLVATDDHLIVAGDFGQKPAGAVTNIASFARKTDLAGSPIWEQDFQDVMKPSVIEASENKQLFVYLVGTVTVMTTQTTSEQLVFTAKLDGSSGAILWTKQWQDDWGTAAVPNPKGGVIVISHANQNGNCGFVGYDPSGNTSWEFRQTFSGSDSCSDATLTQDANYLYVVGAVNIFTANQETLAAKFALPQ